MLKIATFENVCVKIAKVDKIMLILTINAYLNIILSPHILYVIDEMQHPINP